MDTEYDPDGDAAFVWLGERPDDRSGTICNELWPESLGDKIGLLYDRDRRRIGLEVLEASSRLKERLGRLPSSDLETPGTPSHLLETLHAAGFPLTDSIEIVRAAYGWTSEQAARAVAESPAWRMTQPS